MAENRLSCCGNCEAVLPDPDAVMDAARIGQEAFDKATNLQSRGTYNGMYVSDTFYLMMTCRLSQSKAANH